ncbi:pyruvate dehydrogenase (acetyl-transferring), homodimeric type [Sodalis-like secondary symbiont of Drepanosiphum platanoidis]|uniref:pyruvate dehydrogenase (acetyl-transferring), homodimeric type n=1 Tax=Sodalis-like secondary symbiont of Drepanosiphum platanoidis TaxID=2994493 RepID=UPI003464BF67
MSKDLYHDIDPIETKEWIDSIESVIKNEGKKRAKFLIKNIIKKTSIKKYFLYNSFCKDYINTISVEEEEKYPGDLDIEYRIRSVIRWNALMIVLRASRKNLELGGHIASFQSAATIYEVCFNHFFRAKNSKDNGDIIYFQGHISPGIYSRAFLEGRLNEEQLDNFRQEVNKKGLSSYPHPRMMPEFWQFPTVSMGLGPINAIYQAKFLKYLHNRSIKDTSSQTIYAFLGDGEMDEPESKGALSVAGRNKLDNLIFLINCNLQRLDGPVFGNGKIINELENIFYGSGWEVIKVIWNSKWDNLFKKDKSGKLIKLINETVDGDFQNYTSKNAEYIRKNFFGKYIETKNLIKDMKDEEILELNRGGHDSKKIYSAIKRAKEIIGKPVVILFHTVKGYGMGTSAEGMNIAHQVKKIDIESLKYFRNRFNLSNITDEKISYLPYIKFKKNSEEYNYLHKNRKKLYGYVPKRNNKFKNYIKIPSLKNFQNILIKQKKNISTTIAFLRILNILLKKDKIKNYIVPIIPDEARTFGMEGLFRTIGIYNSEGQKYIPEDYKKISFYKENKSGQILQEGINELGSVSSWIAAATSYSTNNLPMIPFYIYYSMFGFQRTGDLYWSAGDQQAKGFLIGATSGRTTLNGEGLQHADGHSHIQSLTIPSCISYNPTYAYEIAVIIQNGLERMYGKKQENIYYYITTLNEKYHMPSMPKNSENGICKGIYKIKNLLGNNGHIQLIGSGSILLDVIAASKILSSEYNIGSDVYSATSFTELARDGHNCIRWNMLNPSKKPKIPYIAKILNNSPIVISTDYMRLFAEQIRNFVSNNDFFVLGTDGFGLSDSRENLRSYFEINTNYIVVSSLYVLSKNKMVSIDLVEKAIIKYSIDINKINPQLV